MTRAFFITAFIFAIAGCGGSGAIGDTCATTGATTNECGDDAVCTPVGTALVCAKICTAQEDCADDENCNGLTGNLKSCQPK
ncbi:Hypothetical protein A7982_08890 [Minicystis rosea]|nr:Hypothetical protein A7982_08890 [Minicystis rosea]